MVLGLKKYWLNFFASKCKPKMLWPSQKRLEFQDAIDL